MLTISLPYFFQRPQLRRVCCCGARGKLPPTGMWMCRTSILGRRSRPNCAITTTNVFSKSLCYNSTCSSLPAHSSLSCKLLFCPLFPSSSFFLCHICQTLVSGGCLIPLVGAQLEGRPRSVRPHPQTQTRPHWLLQTEKGALSCFSPLLFPFFV